MSKYFIDNTGNIIQTQYKKFCGDIINNKIVDCSTIEELIKACNKNILHIFRYTGATSKEYTQNGLYWKPSDSEKIEKCLKGELISQYGENYKFRNYPVYVDLNHFTLPKSLTNIVFIDD